MFPRLGFHFSYPASTDTRETGDDKVDRPSRLEEKNRDMDERIPD